MAADRPERKLRKPKHYVRHIKQFGSQGNHIGWWAPEDEGEDDERSLRLAYFQHRVAQMTNVKIATDRRYLTTKAFATAIGVDPAHLGRKLRGDSWASIGDYFRWAMRLGIDILPASFDTMLPPENLMKEWKPAGPPK